MGVLKYTKADGQVVSLNVYKVNNVIVSQEKGQSEADVMSQKSVTDFLDSLYNEITETNNNVSEKADADNVYTKTETDNKLSAKADTTAIPTNVSELNNDSGYLTAHQSLTNYPTKTEMTTADNEIKSDLSDLGDRITELEEDILVIDGGEY